MNKTAAILAAGVLGMLFLGGALALFMFQRAQRAEALAVEARLADVRAQERVAAQRLELPAEADSTRESSRLRDRVAELEREVEALRAQLEAGAPEAGTRADLEALEAPLAWLHELSPTRFGGMTAEELAYLRDLDLTGLEITDAALDHLWDLPALEHLELGATSLSEAAVRRFIEAHPDCYVHSRWSR